MNKGQIVKHTTKSFFHATKKGKHRGRCVDREPLSKPLDATLIDDDDDLDNLTQSDIEEADNIIYAHADEILSSVEELERDIAQGAAPMFESVSELRKYLDEV